jgi:hypothetical protein
MRIIWLIILFGLSISIHSFAQRCILPLQQLSQKGITISHLPGFYSSELALEFKTPGNISLYVTTNGNIPSETNYYHLTPLKIINTQSVTVSLKQNKSRSDTLYCGTYFINFSSKLPVVSLTLPNAFLFDPQTGIYVGGLRDETTRYGNCWSKMEKPVFFEYYPDKNSSTIAQYSGLRIFGGMTRAYPEKSMRLIARKKYGKGKFKSKVFKDKNIDRFNSLVLRISGNDNMSTRFKDMMISSVARDMHLDYMAFQPAVLLVNGEYWGIHNIREKIDEHYIHENHGIPEDSINILQGNAYAEHGTSKDYKALMQYLSTHPPQFDSFRDSVDKMIDIDNFFKYQILQIHIANPDYMGNIRFWNQKSGDKRFRWIYYDGDLSFANYQSAFIQKRLSPEQTEWFNPTWSTLILRKLLQNPYYRNKFINQYCFELATHLTADTLVSRINYFHDWLYPEIDRHLTRRNFFQSKKNWEAQVEKLRSFARFRNKYSFIELSDALSLKSSYQLKLKNDFNHQGVQLMIGSDQTDAQLFQGQFFRDIPLTIGYKLLNPELAFTGWSDGFTSGTRELKNIKDSSLFVFPIFQPRKTSSENNSVHILAFANEHGKKQSWIAINHQSKNQTSASLMIKGLDQRVALILVDTGIHIYSTDTVIWKQQHQGNYILHQLPKHLTSFQIEDMYLVDDNEQIMDKVSKPVGMILNNSMDVYFVRSSNEYKMNAVFPDLYQCRQENKQSPIAQFKSNWITISLIISAMLFCVYFLLNQRKKRK